MPIDIQAAGFLGIAFEAVAGTYVAPTKFVKLRSESLRFLQDSTERRLIRGIADLEGLMGGPSRVEGDIEVELTHDVLPYFMYASRNTVVKTGTAAPFTYTGTPFHGATPTTARTLSITVVRAGLGFGYTGSVAGSMTITTDAGTLIGTISVLGRDEQSVAVPTAPNFANIAPFGHGMYTIGNPTGTTVLDTDTFSLQVEDNAVAETRLANTRAPQFIRYGERSVQLTMSRDFADRTEYDTFKAYTSRSVRVIASNGTHSIQLTTPAAIKDDYAVSGLAGQGDLVRADITYRGTFDPTSSKSYELVVVTTESII